MSAKREAMFWKVLNGQDKSVQCNLCPHNCVIHEHKTGVCKARKNTGGVLHSLNYGEITSIALDPIEKSHFITSIPAVQSSLLVLGDATSNVHSVKTGKYPNKDLIT